MKLVSLLARTVALALCAGVLACSQPPPSTTASAPDPQAAAQVGPARTLPNTLPAPSADHPRFVGLWAASVEGCADPAWRFHADRLSTQGEVLCRFQSVQQTQTGYDINASCSAEGPPERDYHIQIGFAESARAMMLSGGPWSAPIGLVYCAEIPNP